MLRSRSGKRVKLAAVKPGAWPRLVGSRRRRALVESLLLRPPAGDEARSSAAVSGEK